MFQFLHISIDIRFTLSHVEFEEGLSIAAMKNKATRYKSVQLQIEKFLKSQVARPLYFKPRFFKLSVSCNRSRLRVCQSFQDDWSVFIRVKTQRRFPK
jgi:hypothetical protein